MKAVVFDIGETLIDETRPWSVVANWLAVPQMTMFAVLGKLVAERRDHRELFDIVRPDVGWNGVRERFRDDAAIRYLPQDLYPDVRPTFDILKRKGYFLGIAGNQPADREKDLRRMKLPADLIATSGRWGVSKPSPEFFDRIAREVKCRPEEIAYVGDRVDNDVVPAAAAGMVPIHIVRGAWGYIQRDWPEVSRDHAQLQSLEELSDVLDRLNRR